MQLIQLVLDSSVWLVFIFMTFFIWLVLLHLKSHTEEHLKAMMPSSTAIPVSTVGVWPTWPETLAMARRRFAERLLVYISRGAKALYEGQIFTMINDMSWLTVEMAAVSKHKKDFWCTMGFLGIFLSAAKADFWCLEALTPLCLHLIFLNVWMWCGCVIVITWSITHGCHNLWRNLWLCCKARRNFLLVSHADCVASCLALMPHGRVVEAVDYGATMLAWRTPLPALLTSPRLWWKSLE